MPDEQHSSLEPLETVPLAWSDYHAKIHRFVEGQHYIATRQLVDSPEEHELLERLLDDSKPPAPLENSRGKLHYLLFTPFRYPPLRHGGRFHRPFEQSIFYGSSMPMTAMAEISYHRFVFIAHSAADFLPMDVPYTHFQTRISSQKAILLTAPPFDAYRAEISDPASYARSQPLGTRLREAGAEMFTAFSARWAEGHNIGLFTPEAFATNKPSSSSHWIAFVSEDRVEFSQPGRVAAPHAFQRADFEVGGVLPVL